VLPIVRVIFVTAPYDEWYSYSSFKSPTVVSSSALVTFLRRPAWPAVP
jgi:hypothetical protein